MPVFLKQIEILNFKSFRGQILIGPMVHFTAIIGPNGSGKSNIMDAISFVMGEKAKNLRVKQMSELIYGASVGKPVAKSAYVTAVFILDDCSIRKFTRIIHETSSEYKIDNKEVLRKEYLSQLNKYGLNVKAKNFLVFQGDIESIAMKSPKEITLILEEISNSIRYRADYNRLFEEMTKANLEVEFVMRKKKQLVSVKSSLTIEREEAHRYEVLKKEYVNNKIKLFLLELFYIKKDIDDLNSDARNKEQAMRQFEKDKNDATDLLQQKKRELGSLSRQLVKIEQELAIIDIAFVKKNTIFSVAKEEISYFEMKTDSANKSLAAARAADEIHRKTVQELQDLLKEMENMKTSLQGSIKQLEFGRNSVEFSNSQINRYLELETRAEQQSVEYTAQLKLLNSEQKADQNKLDDKDRRKMELENKLKQKNFMMDEAKKRFKRLEQFIKDTETALMKIQKNKQDLKTKVDGGKNKVQILQDELKNITEQLSEAKADNYQLKMLKRKSDTIKILKELFTGYGRLSELCKPIHSRYNIAVAKVFGKYMDAIVVNKEEVAKQCILHLREQKLGVETFLPVDSLKVKDLKSKLRDIQSPRNVKLIYDILQFSPEEIDKVVLFVTNNTLVCETSKDANQVAYEIGGRTRYNCVALDGTFYRKNGIFSGGKKELSEKAKRWEQNQLVEIRSEQDRIRQELTECLCHIKSESDIGIMDVEIYGLMSRLKFSKVDFEDTEKQIITLNKESKAVEKDLALVCDKITFIKEAMDERKKEIERIENHINSMKDDIFANFCNEIGMKNIREYEQGDLRMYQKLKQKELELNENYDRIQNQLEFEKGRDMNSNIVKYENILQELKEKIEFLQLKERFDAIEIEDEKNKIKELQSSHKATENEVENMEKQIGKCREKIGTISKSILKTQTDILSVITNIQKKKAKWHDILTDAKVEGIAIPMTNHPQIFSSSTDITSSVDTVERNEEELELQIDFTCLPNTLQRLTVEIVEDIKSQIGQELTNARREMEIIKNPNLKAEEKLSLITAEINETSDELKKTRKRAIELTARFDTVKKKRYEKFTDCLKHIVDKIDSIYKELVDNPSGQAILIPENLEEPYLQGICYSCIAPGKCFLPLSELSGGEKTIAAMALLFALQSYNPTPLFVLDEIDASLDKPNIRNVIRYIRSKEEVQFIVISLSKEFYSHADSLIGISALRSEGCPQSQVFTLFLKSYSTSLKK